MRKYTKFFIKCSLFLLVLCVMNSWAQANIFPRFDHELSDWPRKFRTTKDELKTVSPVKEEGLKDLKASGSGQFSEQGLKTLIKLIPPSHIFLIDLRQESHGFINGRALSWFDGFQNEANCKKTLAEIEADEQKRLEGVLKVGKIGIKCEENQNVPVQRAQTEKQIAESLGLTYLRLPVTDHHRPSDKIVDEYVEFIKNLPSDAWLHLHCRGGKGRTTTFMIMYDMMLNTPKVSFDDILERHKLIGGTDLRALHTPDHYRYQPGLDRLNFIKAFYQYCQQVPHFDLSWSDWVAKQDKN